MATNNLKQPTKKGGYADQFKDRDQLLSPKTKVQNWLVNTSHSTSPSLENFNMPKTHPKRVAKKTKIKAEKLPTISKANNKEFQEEKEVNIFLFLF